MYQDDNAPAFKPQLPTDLANLSVPLVAMVTQLTMPTQHNALMQKAVLSVNEQCKVNVARIGK
jgi:hypothetical protein